MTDSDDSALTNGSGRRRYWKKDEKRRIVTESFSDGASVAKVARRYGLNANLLFTWRRQLAAEREANAPAAILPVTIAPSPQLPLGASPEAPGRMEITLPGGEKIIVGADVEAAALSRVIKALRR